MACNLCTTVDFLIGLSDGIEEGADPLDTTLWESINVVLETLMGEDDFEDFLNRPINPRWQQMMIDEMSEVDHL